MTVIHRIESHQRRKQSPVGLGEGAATEITLLRQMELQHIQRIEQFPHRLFVDILAGGEAGAIHAVIDRVIDAFVPLLDLRLQRQRIEIGQLSCG